VFKPLAADPQDRADLVWIGNWGDDERAAELQTFLYTAARTAGVSGSVYGVRYPAGALYSLRESGLEFRGWAPNYRVPELFSQHRFTVHIPRRFYRDQLPGVPTIRVFEALACGIPLICAPWSDSENLFRPGRDYLAVRSGEEMSAAMRLLATDEDLAKEFAAAGLSTIRSRHSCAHRVDELLHICAGLRPAAERRRKKVASCA
jgi:spore maturation protein CgeB